MSSIFKIHSMTEGYTGDVSAPTMREAFMVAGETEKLESIYIEYADTLYYITREGDIVTA